MAFALHIVASMRVTRELLAFGEVHRVEHVDEQQRDAAVVRRGFGRAFVFTWLALATA